MSTDFATLARYIQEIAWSPEVVKSKLKDLRTRGTIPGIYTEAGGIQDDERETCCDPENNGVIEDDPDARNPWTGEDGNAPEEYQSTPEGVTDCETGEAISVNFVGGFSQSETCKECGPDETWEQGFYWEGEGGLVLVGNYASHALAYQAAAPYIIPSTGADPAYKTSYELTPSGNQANITYADYSGSYIALLALRRSCSTLGDTDYCPSEAPEICGDDWESDNKTQYTLRNGCYVASKCDPDAPTSALGCNEELTLCQDGVSWTFRPTSDGGWIQYDPAGIRTGGKYDGRTGKRTAVIPPGQESMY
jgi:hypothetical protein